VESSGRTCNTVIEVPDHVIAEHDGWLGDVVVPSVRGILPSSETKCEKHLRVYEILCDGSSLTGVVISPVRKPAHLVLPGLSADSYEINRPSSIP
jgi:hypothetical protein